MPEHDPRTQTGQRCRIDTKAGNAELWRMVRNSRGRGIRITAAMTLPDTAVVDALLEIMNDHRGVNSIRVETGKTAMDRDGKRVRRGFAALADDRSLSAAAREDIRRYLARRR